MGVVETSEKVNVEYFCTFLNEDFTGCRVSSNNCTNPDKFESVNSHIKDWMKLLLIKWYHLRVLFNSKKKKKDLKQLFRYIWSIFDTFRLIVTRCKTVVKFYFNLKIKVKINVKISNFLLLSDSWKRRYKHFDKFQILGDYKNIVWATKDFELNEIVNQSINQSKERSINRSICNQISFNYWQNLSD